MQTTVLLRSAALISFVLVLPMAILESLNNTVTAQNAPGLVALFGVLWLLPTGFIAILLPTVRSVRAGARILSDPLHLLFRVAVLILIAVVWAGIVVDQSPCFFGVPKCD